jgi:hypothetical protein
MQHRIPAVMFVTWPDMWYHSSQDTPDKQDSTQYKACSGRRDRSVTVIIAASGVGAAPLILARATDVYEQPGPSAIRTATWIPTRFWWGRESN